MQIDHAQAYESSCFYNQEDQMQGIQQIVDKISNDRPTTAVTRLITSSDMVLNCKRPKDMSFASFFSKFMLLASEHLVNIGITLASQVGEVLAFTLLNNSRLQ